MCAIGVRRYKSGGWWRVAGFEEHTWGKRCLSFGEKAEGFFVVSPAFRGLCLFLLCESPLLRSLELESEGKIII